MSTKSLAIEAPAAIQTSRLELRGFNESDWPPLCDLFRDEECTRYTVKTPLENWQTWRTLASYIGHWKMRGYGPYAVIERSSGDLVGTVGLWYPGDWPEPELKWALRRRFWGQGFATEAGTSVLNMAMKELKWTRLISVIFTGNHRSVAVAKRIGGEFEMTIPFRSSTADIFAYRLLP
jgi:RimJ/RimL family protein N-acetyltransferase